MSKQTNSDQHSEIWWVYLIRIEENNALYCGITNNLLQRYRQHQSGKGAKYFRGKTIVDMPWHCTSENRSEASKLEAHIKSLTKVQKEKLILEMS